MAAGVPAEGPSSQVNPNPPGLEKEEWFDYGTSLLNIVYTFSEFLIDTGIKVQTANLPSRPGQPTSTVTIMLLSSRTRLHGAHMAAPNPIWTTPQVDPCAPATLPNSLMSSYKTGPGCSLVHILWFTVIPARPSIVFSQRGVIFRRCNELHVLHQELLPWFPHFPKGGSVTTTIHRVI